MKKVEFHHLTQEQLKKRVKLMLWLLCLAAAVCIASVIVYLSVDDKPKWSWLLIAATYNMLAIHYFQTRRRMQKEIEFREERKKKKYAPEVP